MNVPQIENLEHQLESSQQALQTEKDSVEAANQHIHNIKNEISKAFEERMEMAKKCLEKDEEVTFRKFIKNNN